MSGWRNRLLAVCTSAALVAGIIGIGATPAKAAIISASDVAASIAAPNSSNAAFSATGTITNTGLLPQPAGSTLTIAASGGSISGLPAGCAASGGAAVCTAAALNSGAAQSFSVTVTPNVGAVAVTTTATVSAALLEINVLPDSANNTASKLTGVVYTVGGVDIVSRPSTVRNGDDTLLTVTVNNSGAPQNISVAINTGNVYDNQLALPAGCSANGAGSIVTCVGAYTVGQTRSYDVAVITPTTGSSITSTATATGANGGTASDSTNTALYSDATAFVPEGDCLASDHADASQSFCVPDGSAPGLFLDLNQVTVAANCGASPCETFAVEALFPDTGVYAGNDPQNPFLWDINYGKLTCNGNGNGANCTDVLYYILSGQTTPVKMQKCSTYGAPDPAIASVNDVCLQNAVKNDGEWTFTVALLKDIVIPIIGGVASGR